LVVVELELRILALLVVMVLILFFQLLPQQAVGVVRLTMGREELVAVVVVAQKIRALVVLGLQIKVVLAGQDQVMWITVLVAAVVVLVQLAQTEAQVLQQMLAALVLQHLLLVHL
jgi:hypothetical protein